MASINLLNNPKFNHEPHMTYRQGWGMLASNSEKHQSFGIVLFVRIMSCTNSRRRSAHGHWKYIVRLHMRVRWHRSSCLNSY